MSDREQRVDLEQLEQLERLAKEATPGPWNVSKIGAGFEIERSNGDCIVQVQQIESAAKDIYQTKRRATALYIAAASPDVILALLAENAKQAEQIREARELLERYVFSSELFGFGIDPRVKAWIKRNALPDTGAETKEDGNG